MGNQGHSEANYFQFKTWVEAGIIKDVTAITAHMNNPRRWHGWDCNMKSMPAGEPVPSTLDWDTWLGTEFWHDYNHDYINGQWRCWYDFGMGALGDWGRTSSTRRTNSCTWGCPRKWKCCMPRGTTSSSSPIRPPSNSTSPSAKGCPPATSRGTTGWTTCRPYRPDTATWNWTRTFPPRPTGKSCLPS